MYWRFSIGGIVQGVGFRPFIKKLADELKINGRVFNSEQGVVVEFAAERLIAETFRKRIFDEKPSAAWIESFVKSSEQDLKIGDGFSIDPSMNSGVLNLRLTPDFKLCDSCIEDLKTHPRRKDYAFTTCTICGPRFSIAKGFPFDREQLSISDFKMCADCSREYIDVKDRRFHSQTNSCKTCGPQLDTYPEAPKGTNLIEEAVLYLTQGKIIAVQTTTGFLLMADATNEKVIERLRSRKNRPQKPFAVVYQDLDHLAEDFKIEENQAELLCSAVGPIVLLESASNTKLANNIAPGLNEIGVMLPSNPLVYLIIQQFSKPLIATSGNRGGSPLIANIDEAKLLLEGIVDLYLYHHLEIVHPMDDSVTKMVGDHPIIIRPARGLTPNYIGGTKAGNNTVIAFGADMKAHYALFHEGKCYLSPYFGNLESFEVQERMKFSLRHLINVLDLIPQEFLIDVHPGYFSRALAESFSNEFKVPLKSIPHHQAHFCSGLADHGLFQRKTSILGIILDGVGFLEGEKLGGAELFEYHQGEITPIEVFSFYPIIAGDKMSTETRLSLLSIYPDSKAIPGLFNHVELELYHKLRMISKGRIRSMGRLFDAAAALLGITQINSYEGEAAMKVEAIAARYLKHHSHYQPKHFKVDYGFESYLRAIEDGIEEGRSIGELALNFIATIAYQLVSFALKNQYKEVVCSGGVFQNGLLIHFIADYARNVQINLYFNSISSPNDSGIPIGQLYHNHHIN
ncbi:MAG: carbamoyltransferase HypF [Flavobacteriaceae bacterium]